MRKRDTNCRPVSVRPSVTLVIQTAKNIVKLLSRSGSPIILVSWGRQVLPNSKGNPLSGALNTRGRGRKLRFFFTEIPVYLRNGTRYANGCCETFIGSYREPIDPCRFWWLRVTWKKSNFYRDLLHYALTVWPRMTRYSGEA